MLIISASICLGAGAAIPQAAAYSPPKAALIIDGNSGRTLHASNAREARFPASLTKVMTLYILFDYLRHGRLSMDTMLTVSADAAKRPPSKIGFKPGDSLTVRAAIRLLVTKSANDVAAVVAENIAGSEEKFAESMTATARAMGMNDTTFRNASGLPDSRQKTTAHDMVILARRMLSDFPRYAENFKTRYTKYRGKTYRSHNRLLFNYQGVHGLKTGFIRASGFNVMIAARRGEKRLIGVVMGGPSARARDARARRLLDAAWPKASVRAPEMAAHLPRRNPAFAPSQRERQIRTRLAQMPGASHAMLFKHEQSSATALTHGHATSPAPQRKLQARLLPARKQRSQPDPQPAARGSAQPDAGLDGPYHVQVGAYASAEDARRRLDSVAAKAGRLLNDYPQRTLQAMVHGRQVFRARFGGFEQPKAEQACESLKRISVDCIAVGAR